MEKGMRNGTLILNVIHGKEIEVEYAKNDIIDKINSFFGYSLIKKVTLKVIQDKIIRNNKILPKIKNLNKIEEKMNKINNSQLKNNLNKFLKAYNEKNK